MLFPHLADVCIDRVFLDWQVGADSGEDTHIAGGMSGCGAVSGRAHSRHERRLSDNPVGDQEL